MPLYYLHIYNGSGFVEDSEGQELNDLDAARAEAVEGIRSVLASEVLKGSLDLRGRIEVVDGRGAVLAIVPFSEAVAVQLDVDG